MAALEKLSVPVVPALEGLFFARINIFKAHSPHPAHPALAHPVAS